jgi:hypothetical protein
MIYLSRHNRTWKDGLPPVNKSLKNPMDLAESIWQVGRGIARRSARPPMLLAASACLGVVFLLQIGAQGKGLCTTRTWKRAKVHTV